MATLNQELLTYWNPFCDSETGVPSGFIERMEKAGLAECRPADAGDAAAGAKPMGMVWALTEEGRRIWNEANVS